MELAEIIAMAKEENLTFVPQANSPLVRIVLKAVAKEREACAQVCESWDDPRDYAAAIRARGQKGGV